MDQVTQRKYPGPVVVCVRGPSRSGKTAMVERLIERFRVTGHRAAWVKRTHHLLDLPEKSSGRVWTRTPAAMVVGASDRVQVTLPPGDDDELKTLLRACPADADIVLLETHSPEPYPTILSEVLTPAAGESVIGRWAPGADLESVASRLAPDILALLPESRELDLALRGAMSLHGGHACAGLVLGTRLALAGARAVGVPVPDQSKRLLVVAEMDRCAVDALQAVTGCRPGRRTLRILDYGKLAATFIDEQAGRAVRVAARGDLRERAGVVADPRERHEVQRAAYLRMTDDELFSVVRTVAEIGQFDRPGPPGRRVTCRGCGEEVSDGRDVSTEAGPMCRPCVTAAAGAREGGTE